MSLQDPSLRHDLLTKEGVRSGGYGDALMDHVEEFARAAGCEKAAPPAAASAKALRFYERRGFEGPSYAARTYAKARGAGAFRT